ncbi:MULTISPECIES: YqcI/YcgG family protein [Micrococcaceae]|uniref:YqcI/YcgG family protein n=1 Tax=Micrococcaceae TaxID=1268 RepID=UPI00345F5A22
MIEEATRGRLFRRSNAPEETKSLLSEFHDVVAKPHFPCFFAAAAFKNDELLFGVGDISKGLDVVIDLFDAVVDRIREDIDQTVVLWLTGSAASTLDDDRALASRILKHLLTSDPTPWPDGHTMDPTDPTWDFWYKGVDFFVNVSTPHHKLRKSRNLGSAFTLVVQSRTSFDRLGDGASRARTKIRERIGKHDLIDRSPALGEHGAHPEIDQFFLDDSNDSNVEGRLLTKEDIVREKAASGGKS